MKWADGIGTFDLSGGDDYVIQAIKQFHLGPVEEVRYFHHTFNGYEQQLSQLCIQPAAAELTGS
ncbi:TPA: hypothetical protein ACH3X1_000369 [Trebouxia sp. C0004]